ncbi:MAG: hypothetical protein ABJQ70_14980 [Roseobacter sp.]
MQIKNADATIRQEAKKLSTSRVSEIHREQVRDGEAGRESGAAVGERHRDLSSGERRDAYAIPCDGGRGDRARRPIFSQNRDEADWGELWKQVGLRFIPGFRI